MRSKILPFGHNELRVGLAKYRVSGGCAPIDQFDPRDRAPWLAVYLHQLTGFAKRQGRRPGRPKRVYSGVIPDDNELVLMRLCKR